MNSEFKLLLLTTNFIVDLKQKSNFKNNQSIPNTSELHNPYLVTLVLARTKNLKQAY